MKDFTRHEYRLSAWMRTFYGILACCIAAVSCFMVFLLHSTPNGAPGIGIALVFLGVAIYLFAYALLSRVIIDGSRIDVRSGFTGRTADQSEITGYRTVSTRNGTYRRLYLRDGGSGIRLSNSFATDDFFRDWFAKIPDLDERDKQKTSMTSRRSRNSARPLKSASLASLATAKTIAVFLAIVDGCGVAAVLFAPPPFRWAAAVVLALAAGRRAAGAALAAALCPHEAQIRPAREPGLSLSSSRLLDLHSVPPAFTSSPRNPRLPLPDRSPSYCLSWPTSRRAIASMLREHSLPCCC